MGLRSNKYMKQIKFMLVSFSLVLISEKLNSKYGSMCHQKPILWASAFEVNFKAAGSRRADSEGTMSK